MTRRRDRAAIRRYRICGITLVSDIPFPQLRPAPRSVSEHKDSLDLICLSEPPLTRGPEDWFLNQRRATGKPWMSAARLPEGYLLRFHGWADFFLDRRGQRLVCLQAAGVARDALRHLVLDHVLPLALAQQGRHVLHATAVETAWGACAFTGPAGAGKSTLAASFLRKGCPVLCDDCLVLREGGGRVEALPAYAQVRLHADSFAVLRRGLARVPAANDASGKCRIAARRKGEPFRDSPRPLAAIYLLSDRRLAPKAPPRLVPVEGHAAVMALLTASFTLDASDKGLLERQFDFFSGLPARVPVKQLLLPADLSLLPKAEALILADLREAAAGPLAGSNASMAQAAVPR